MAILTSRLSGRSYRLLAVLARGGMGEVFVGEEVAERPTRYAVKTLLPDVLDQPQMLDRFLDEARLSARLDHPNIARLLDFGVAAGRPFTCFELLGGANLAECLDVHLRRDTSLEPEIALALIEQSCRGLHHAHTLKKDGLPLNVVHRDLSPGNLFLTRDGRVKVLDFGVAWARGRMARTATGMIIGKLDYMAPEHVRGLEVDARTDVFSLGLCLFELLSLRRPYVANDQSEHTALVYNGAVPALEEFRPGLPRKIYRLVRKATEVDPKDRFQSAEEMAEALEDALGKNAKYMQKRLRQFYLGCFGHERDAQLEAKLEALAAQRDSDAPFAWKAPELAKMPKFPLPAPVPTEPNTAPAPQRATFSLDRVIGPDPSNLTLVLFSVAVVLITVLVGLFVGRMTALAMMK